MGAIYDLSAVESKCDFPLAKGLTTCRVRAESTQQPAFTRFSGLKIFSRKKAQEDAKGRGGSSW